MSKRKAESDPNGAPEAKRFAPGQSELYDIYGMKEADCWRETMHEAATVGMHELERLPEVLEKYGVAIVPSVIDEALAGVSRERLWEMLRELSEEHELARPIAKDDPGSWRQWGNFFIPHRNTLCNFGRAGSEPTLWALRVDERVRRVFAAVHGCDPEALHTSQDGFSIALPGHAMETGSRGRSWMHADESIAFANKDPLNKRELCVQGQVLLNDRAVGDATFLCIPGSHRMLPELGGKFPELASGKEGDHWVKLTDEHHRYFAEHCAHKPFAVAAPVGSMVLWNSRTIHSGKNSLSRDSMRMVAYICQRPMAKVPKAEKTRSRRIFLEHRTGSHRTAKMFGMTPQSYGRKIGTVSAPRFSDPLRYVTDERLRKLARRMVCSE